MTVFLMVLLCLRFNTNLDKDVAGKIFFWGGGGLDYKYVILFNIYEILTSILFQKKFWGRSEPLNPPPGYGLAYI